jgi:hypothetical protein
MEQEMLKSTIAILRRAASAASATTFHIARRAGAGTGRLHAAGPGCYRGRQIAKRLPTPPVSRPAEGIRPTDSTEANR